MLVGRWSRWDDQGGGGVAGQVVIDEVGEVVLELLTTYA